MLDLNRLVWLSNDQLAAYDIAEVNLACAAGLPGSEAMDAAYCLDRLDSLALYVKEFTQRRLPDFFRAPGEYDNSLGYYLILCMITALQRDCGIRYNPAKIDLAPPFEVADTFIFGILQGEGGTCASLPVFYAAVGRRLGYPLKLVSAVVRGVAGHGFARWEGYGDRFNIEACAPGLRCPLDEYYRTGLYEVSAWEEWARCLLQSKTPREELALFLGERALHWKETGNFRETANTFAWSLALQPDSRSLQVTLMMTCDQWWEALQALLPPGFPELFVRWPPRRFPPSVPLELEREGVLGLEAMENLLKDPLLEEQFWGPMRRGDFVSERPTKAHVSWSGDTCPIGIELISTSGAR